jgi:hypothetical protein
MQKRNRLGALLVASFFTLQAQATVIPTDLDIFGYMETTFIDGNGTISASFDLIENGIMTSSTSISDTLGAPTIVGDDPLEVVRLSDTNSGYSVESSFVSNAESNDFDFADFEAEFGFFAENNTIDDYKLTWSFVFDLSADASVGEFINTYMFLDDFFDTIFERDLYSDMFFGDLIVTDGVEDFPPTFGAALSTSGTFSFMQTVASGDVADFGGIFGFSSEIENALGSHAGSINFDVMLASIENLTNNNPPPPPTNVPEPAPLALMLLSLGLLQLRRRK